MKLVHNIPSIDEFNGLDDNELLFGDLDFSSDDDDLERLVVVLGGLYFDFYEMVKYFGVDYFSSDKFVDDVLRLGESLEEQWSVLLEKYIKSRHDY